MISQPCALEPSAYFLVVESQAQYNVYLSVPETCLTFHRVWEGKARTWRAACPRTPCEAELRAGLAPGEECRGPRDRGRECGSPWLGLGILAMACSLSCAFLCRGSPALEVLSAVRFCGVPVGTVEMPQGSDLAADQRGQKGKF